ncbi:2Fe-2S iron-sulfur cluster protein [Collimonas sp. PA-H2]|uniref:2Fe-2S iron-sulfur cluster-binding protein n=1 Tax=Collimonas sp. PA-H2 TaxID=1881062 RepID=UPI000C01E285|nr:2Fe-2S iron-sulfur cluster-binding protein [Collimonas sp. PA-H2]PFH10422.1 2Fe-2S iron-sulfur cluster protein [Collimonas sp. PA-H2]
MAELMAENRIEVNINGSSVTVAAGCSVAAALAVAAAPGITRRSVSGMPRAPLCGMGICQECRVSIDGRAHRLACQTECVAGMRIETAQAAA